MTLQEMASLINKALRYKAHPNEVIISLDAVQKLAFTENITALKEYYTNMTIYQELEFLSAGYTNAIVGDIGDTVEGADSGATGTLISYNNTTRKWVIETSDDFDESEDVVVLSGTGVGTLLATDHQTMFKGPYAYPTAPPVRKMHGVTTVPDTRIFGSEVTLTNDVDDYGLILNGNHETRFFQPGRNDEINRTFTFTSDPNLDSIYRWFYWFNPDTITSVTADNALVLIPSAYHGLYVQACVAWINAYVKGEPFTKKHVEAYFKDWWDSLRAVYTPMGKNSNQTSKGSYLGNWFSI